MTVETQIKKVTATGNASAREFSYAPLRIFKSSDLQVFRRVISTGVETLLAEGTGTANYSVAPTTFSADGNVGTITYPADSSGTALPSTDQLVMRRNLTLEQKVKLTNQGAYFADVQERAFDRLVMYDIQQQDELDRALKVAASDGTTDIEVERTASRYLRWNAAATDIDAVAITTSSAAASDAAPADVSLTAAAAGTSGDFSRADHEHLLPTTVPRLATENAFTESQIWFKGADVASAGTITLGAGNWFDITGTTTITEITSIGTGTLIILHFDGVLTLQHDSTNFVLPDGRDIVTFAGMEAMFYEYATGDFRLVAMSAEAPPAVARAFDPSLMVRLYDDFIGDTLDGGWSGAGGSDAQALAPALNQQVGGVVRLVSGDVGGGDDAVDASVLTHDLNWRADKGALMLEVNLDLDAITLVSMFIGFTDQLGTTSVEHPLEGSAGNTLVANAGDACGVLFDTANDTDEWSQAGVAATVVTAQTFAGSAPVAGTRVKVRVEVSASGAVEGFIDDVSIGTAVASAVTSTALLTPCVSIMTRTTASRTVDIDYLLCQEDR